MPRFLHCCRNGSTTNPTKNIKKVTVATISILTIPKFLKFIGESSPGYTYGNMKNHKQGKSLRQIMSHALTSTYTIGKKLNEILILHVSSPLFTNINK
ncbi:hypothetical protein E2C01_055815 [Portunus trituberculatus]|uniref:Uncharacterized protein n=1 Tax=Portunus trituberculatus TaxID=210409 RepID=A0A5B7GNH4_PORTR|nr:hypothetical protein [Portunus trituberculatus]